MTIQIWRCLNCRNERVYGNAEMPDSNVVRALLQCERPCSGRHMPHVFVRVEDVTWRELEERVN